jgi:outer membrane protein TolC
MLQSQWLRDSMKSFGINSAVLAAVLVGCGLGSDAEAQIANPAESLPSPELSINQSQEQDRRQALNASPETLDDAWQAALAYDRQLAAGNLNVSAASRVRAAAGAERLPSLTLGANYLRLSDEVAFSRRAPPPIGGLPLFGPDSAGFHALVYQPIYTSGRISNGIEAADSEVSQAQSSLDRDKLDLKMYVAETYVAVLHGIRVAELANSKLTSVTAQAVDVEKRFQSDKASKNDLLTVQVAQADAQQQAIRATNNLAIIQATYNRALGRNLTAPVNIADLEIGPESGDLNDLTTMAQQCRPEIAELAARAATLRAQANATRAKTSPQVGMHGGYVFQGDKFIDPNGAAVLALTAEWGIFDSGRTSNEAAALCEKAEAAICIQKDMEASIALEVRQRWLELQTARQQVVFARTAIAQAEENLRATTERYGKGVANNTEVLEAEALRTQASTNLYTSLYEAILADLRLKRAIGKF